MRPPPRWPLHPAPREGESLSSWLNRVATAYGMYGYELLNDDLGFRNEDMIDFTPSPGLLPILAERSGVPLDTLRAMSFAAWTPWLLDSLEPVADGFNGYVGQCSVLLPPAKRQARTVPAWRAWLPSKPLAHTCPVCFRSNGGPVQRLMWRTTLTLSCPLHHCRLEPGLVSPDFWLNRLATIPRRRAAAPHVLALDRKTWAALSTGWVQMAHQRIHAGLWFRLLRALIEELSGAQIVSPVDVAEVFQEIWVSAKLPPRGGLRKWQPYEDAEPEIQVRLLEAAAVAVDLLERGQIKGAGQHAKLLMPRRPEIILNGKFLRLSGDG